jgi:hypothetical protein
VPLKKRIPLPETCHLHELFTYEPETGKLCWAVNPKGGNYKGNIAGTVHIKKDKDGKILEKRRIVTVKYQRYLASRIIWKMQTGRDPIEFIDHRNGDALDDRWENLREATVQQNNQNRIGRRKSLSGIKGVYFDATRPGKPWQTYIVVNNIKKHLGRFATAEEAIAARQEAASKQYGEFACKAAA